MAGAGNLGHLNRINITDVEDLRSTVVQPWSNKLRSSNPINSCNHSWGCIGECICIDTTYKKISDWHPFSFAALYIGLLYPSSSNQSPTQPFSQFSKMKSTLQFLITAILLVAFSNAAPILEREFEECIPFDWWLTFRPQNATTYLTRRKDILFPIWEQFSKDVMAAICCDEWHWLETNIGIFSSARKTPIASFAYSLEHNVHR